MTSLGGALRGNTDLCSGGVKLRGCCKGGRGRGGSKDLR